MEYYVFCTILLILFLYGVRIQKSDDSQKEMLQRFNDLRGVFALLIVIGHCSMRFEKEVLPFLFIHKFNMTGVCFSFLSLAGDWHTDMWKGKREPTVLSEEKS